MEIKKKIYETIKQKRGVKDKFFFFFLNQAPIELKKKIAKTLLSKLEKKVRNHPHDRQTSGAADIAEVSIFTSSSVSTFIS